METANERVYPKFTVSAKTYLQVNTSEIMELGLITKISAASAQSGDWMFIEDKDQPLFLNTLINKGIRWKIVDDPINNYSKLKAKPYMAEKMKEDIKWLWPNYEKDHASDPAIEAISQESQMHTWNTNEPILKKLLYLKDNKGQLMLQVPMTLLIKLSIAAKISGECLKDKTFAYLPFGDDRKALGEAMSANGITAKVEFGGALQPSKHLKPYEPPKIKEPKPKKEKKPDAADTNAFQQTTTPVHVETYTYLEDFKKMYDLYKLTFGFIKAHGLQDLIEEEFFTDGENAYLCVGENRQQIEQALEKENLHLEYHHLSFLPNEIKLTKEGRSALTEKLAEIEGDPANGFDGTFKWLDLPEFTHTFEGGAIHFFIQVPLEIAHALALTPEAIESSYQNNKYAFLETDNRHDELKEAFAKQGYKIAPNMQGKGPNFKTLKPYKVPDADEDPPTEPKPKKPRTPRPKKEAPPPTDAADAPNEATERPTDTAGPAPETAPPEPKEPRQADGQPTDHCTEPDPTPTLEPQSEKEPQKRLWNNLARLTNRIWNVIAKKAS
jgi:hypothetical protein